MSVAGAEPYAKLLHGALPSGVWTIRLYSPAGFGMMERKKMFCQQRCAGSSPPYYDACSLVVFEAMASGLPCITTRFRREAAGVIPPDGVDGFILDHNRLKAEALAEQDGA